MILICGVNADDNERDIKTSLYSSNRFIFHLAHVLWLWPPLILSSSSRSSTPRSPVSRQRTSLENLLRLLKLKL